MLIFNLKCQKPVLRSWLTDVNELLNYETQAQHLPMTSMVTALSPQILCKYLQTMYANATPRGKSDSLDVQYGTHSR